MSALSAIIRIVKRMQGSIHVNDEDLQRLAKMHYSYSAVAKCHPDDKFDRDKGRQIADEKLQKKLAAATDKAVNRWKKHHCGLIKNI